MFEFSHQDVRLYSLLGAIVVGIPWNTSSSKAYVIPAFGLAILQYTIVRSTILTQSPAY